MDIDLQRIEADLKKSAGDIRFTLQKHKGCRLSIRETDNRVDLYINPKRIRSQGQLYQILADCQEEFVR